MGPQDPVAPVVVKSVYWGLEDMEHPIHTKFNIYDCLLTINVISKNDLEWITGAGTSHIGKVNEWGGYYSSGQADISSYLLVINF